MVHDSNTTSRIKNQPSNSISCSDNALRLLVLVTDVLYRGLQVTPSFPIWNCVLKGCFEKGIYFERPNHVWRALKTSILNTGHRDVTGLAYCVTKGWKLFHLQGNKIWRKKTGSHGSMLVSRLNSRHGPVPLKKERGKSSNQNFGHWSSHSWSA